MTEIKNTNNLADAPKPKAHKLPEGRKEKLQMMKALKMNVNFKLMTLDKEDEKYEEEQLELLSQLKGIETQITKVKLNRLNSKSKLNTFTPSGVMNRKQRRSA